MTAFVKQITTGNWITIALIVIGFAGQWGAFRLTIAEHDKAIKDQALKMMEVSSRVAVIEGSRYTSSDAMKDRRETDQVINANAMRIARVEETLVYLREGQTELKSLILDLRKGMK